MFRVSDSLALSSVATVNLTVIAPPDTNANNLPDAWEAAYGFTDPNGDADGDGQTNLSEYFANTNPTNATSQLKLVGGEYQLGGPFNLTWSAIGGTRYRVQFADGDLSGGFSDLIRALDIEMDASSYGTTSTQAFTDNFLETGTPTNGSRHYRIKVVP